MNAQEVLVLLLLSIQRVFGLPINGLPPSPDKALSAILGMDAYYTPHFKNSEDVRDWCDERRMVMLITPMTNSTTRRRIHAIYRGHVRVLLLESGAPDDYCDILPFKEDTFGKVETTRCHRKDDSKGFIGICVILEQKSDPSQVSSLTTAAIPSTATRSYDPRVMGMVLVCFAVTMVTVALSLLPW